MKKIAAAFGGVPNNRADAGACVPPQGTDGGMAAAGQQHEGGSGQEAVKTFVSCLLGKLRVATSFRLVVYVYRRGLVI
ncbi:hypothetical protein AB0D11_35880 [Streptomyces monashensis]|uniref:hypothetical protein n=1 Tax=Streptomyces monashensis TaxID=1678012 RepID=UPI0033CBC8A2